MSATLFSALACWAKSAPPRVRDPPGSCSRVLESPNVVAGSEGVVVEDQGWHGEVLPTSVVLLAGLGLHRITIYKQTGGRDRPKNMQNLMVVMRRWGLSPRWILRPPKAIDVPVFRNASVVLYQSPEYQPDLSLSRVLELLGPRTRVLLGCHNYGACRKRLLNNVTRLPERVRTRVVPFFWTLRHPSVLPYYMGGLPHSTPGEPPLRQLLFPGRLDKGKRHYGALRELPPGMKVVVFGEGIGNNSESSRRSFARLLGQQTRTRLSPSIQLASGSYEELLRVAHSSAFILAPFLSVDMYHPQSKMSAAINMALATGKPVITNAMPVLNAIGCPAVAYCNRACPRHHSSKIHSSVTLALSHASRMSSLEYMNISQCMIEWRRKHFCKAVAVLKQQLWHGAESTAASRARSPRNRPSGGASLPATQSTAGSKRLYTPLDARRRASWPLLKPLLHVYDAAWLRRLLPPKRCSGQMYCAEDVLPQALLRSPVHASAERACLYLPPLRFSERSQGHWTDPVYTTTSLAMINGIVQRTPFYNVTMGRDHIWILAYSNPLPPAAFLRGVLWLTNGDPTWISRMEPPCRVPPCGKSLVERTVVIPPAVPPPMVRFWQKHTPALLERPRDLLASFWAGAVTSRGPDDRHYSDRREIVRRFNYTGGTSGLVPHRASERAKSIWAIAGPKFAPKGLGEDVLYSRSWFVLCPRGLALWTPRPILAVYSRAVPVIIGADELILPLSRTFDWRRFSLRVPSSAIPFLPQLLAAIPKTHVRALRRNASQLRRLLMASPERLAEAVVAETLKIDTPEVARCRQIAGF